MSMLKDWKFDLAPNGYNVTAANVDRLIPVGLKLLPGYNIVSIVKGTRSVRSAYPRKDARYTVDRQLKSDMFRAELAEILLGRCPDWVLWKACIQPSRLVLHFYSGTELYHDEEGNSIAKEHAKLDIKRPDQLGVQLTMPGDGQRRPEAVYQCVMMPNYSLYKDTTILIETVNGNEVASINASKPHFSAWPLK